MWNPLLGAMANVVTGPLLDDMVSEVDIGRVALVCHFSLCFSRTCTSLTVSCSRCSVWMC